MRLILAVVLLMLSYSIGENAINITSCISQNGYFYQLSEPTPDTNSNSLFETRSLGHGGSSQFLSIFNVESGFKSATEIPSNNYCLYRIIESNDFSKNVMRKFFLLKENLLVLGQNKSYYSDKDPCYSIIYSDYYVFTLRRILT